MHALHPAARCSHVVIGSDAVWDVLLSPIYQRDSLTHSIGGNIGTSAADFVLGF